MNCNVLEFLVLTKHYGNCYELIAISCPNLRIMSGGLSISGNSGGGKNYS